MRPSTKSLNWRRMRRKIVACFPKGTFVSAVVDLAPSTGGVTAITVIVAKTFTSLFVGMKPDVLEERMKLTAIDPRSLVFDENRPADEAVVEAIQEEGLYDSPHGSSEVRDL